MIFNFPPSAGTSGRMPSFAYTGDYLVQESGSRWEIAFLTSGTLTLRGGLLCDLFVVAGGKPGSGGSDGSGTGIAIGGAGGKGGGCVSTMGVQLTAGQIAVTIGGSNEASSFGSYSAASGSGSNGGAGASAGSGSMSHAGAGTVGVLAFNGEDSLNFPGRKFGAGGGGGGAQSTYWGTTGNNGAGGTTGGGKGGTGSSRNGTAGAANTGSGGGGSGYTRGDSWGTGGAPGAGGTGVVIIRGGA